MFAPGQSITSTWLNGVTNTISGTSMAAPHVAGAVAAIWGSDLNQASAVVNSIVLASTSPNKISNVGTGSPNLLLYVEAGTGILPNHPPMSPQSRALELPPSLGLRRLIRERVRLVVIPRPQTPVIKPARGVTVRSHAPFLAYFLTSTTHSLSPQPMLGIPLRVRNRATASRLLRPTTTLLLRNYCRQVPEQSPTPTQMRPSKPTNPRWSKPELVAEPRFGTSSYRRLTEC